MILFFRTPTKSVIATEVSQELPSEDIQKLSWLYGEATVENEENLKGCFIGPRREMITPWSTNAVENHSEHGSYKVFYALRNISL